MAKPKPDQQPPSPPAVDDPVAIETAAGAGAAPSSAPGDAGAGTDSSAPASDPLTPADLCAALGIADDQVFALSLERRTVVTRDGQKHRLA